jgi:hypothetical protein
MFIWLRGNGRSLVGGMAELRRDDRTDAKNDRHAKPRPGVFQSLLDNCDRVSGGHQGTVGFTPRALSPSRNLGSQLNLLPYNPHHISAKRRTPVWPILICSAVLEIQNPV